VHYGGQQVWRSRECGVHYGDGETRKHESTKTFWSTIVSKPTRSTQPVNRCRGHRISHSNIKIPQIHQTGTEEQSCKHHIPKSSLIHIASQGVNRYRTRTFGTRWIRSGIKCQVSVLAADGNRMHRRSSATPGKARQVTGKWLSC
jgi:hypothetical protein